MGTSETSNQTSDIVIEQVMAISQRASEIYQEALSDTTTDEASVLIDTLEELAVMVEELRQQNDELIETRKTVEFERQRYYNLFEFAPDGYIITDANGKIEEANQAAISLLNIPEQHVVGKLLISFVPEASRRTFRFVLNQLATTQRIEEWELVLNARSNHTFHAALTVEAVRDQIGQTKTLRWLIRDVSARKQAEEQLQQTRLQNLELIETDRLKSQFIATLSHELRTPMNAILGFSSLLRQQLQRRQEEPFLMDMVERITRNSTNMFGLIEEILDFSKLKANYLELSLESFDLVELALLTVEELRSLADQKALNLQVHSPESELIIVNDRTRVRQVLVNLVSNAIKFTEHGHIALEVKAAPSDQVMIKVSDTGIGITPIDQANIFKEFWQVNQSTSRSHSGTGLGLTIVHNLVTLMHGSIAVESWPGMGTTFQIKLPRQL